MVPGINRRTNLDGKLVFSFAGVAWNYCADYFNFYVEKRYFKAYIKIKE
jgi:hypothetical protein